MSSDVTDQPIDEEEEYRGYRGLDIDIDEENMACDANNSTLKTIVQTISAADTSDTTEE